MKCATSAGGPEKNIAIFVTEPVSRHARSAMAWGVKQNTPPWETLKQRLARFAQAAARFAPWITHAIARMEKSPVHIANPEESIARIADFLN